MWINSLKEFPSARRYNERINMFLATQREGNLPPETLAFNLSLWFHEMKAKDTGCPTKFRSWFSMFSRFFKFTQKGDLKLLLPGLYDQLTTWETGYTEILTSILVNAGEVEIFF